MSFARVNGAVLHWQATGPADAPPLVFANSLGSDFRIWDAVAGMLVQDCGIIRYDQRGHGLYAQHPEDIAGWRNMLVRTPPQGYIATCAALRDADLSAGAAAIRAPCRCVVGDEDASTPPDLVRQTAALITGARFEVIDGAGHLPCIEQPGRLAGLIRGHLMEARHG